MPLSSYLLAMSLGTVIAGVSWATVLFRIDPERAGTLAFILFYLSLGLFLFGALSLGEFVLRSQRRREEPAFLLVGSSVRHAVIFAVLFVVALALQGAHLLSWWSMLFIVLLAVAIEAVALIKEGRAFNSIH